MLFGYPNIYLDISDVVSTIHIHAIILNEMDINICYSSEYRIWNGIECRLDYLYLFTFLIERC